MHENLLLMGIKFLFRKLRFMLFIIGLPGMVKFFAVYLICCCRIEFNSLACRHVLGMFLSWSQHVLGCFLDWYSCKRVLISVGRNIPRPVSLSHRGKLAEQSSKHLSSVVLSWCLGSLPRFPRIMDRDQHILYFHLTFLCWKSQGSKSHLEERMNNMNQRGALHMDLLVRHKLIGLPQTTHYHFLREIYSL